MAERDSRRIGHQRMREPHIRGRRISVRQVYARVEERGEPPEAVADRYDLDLLPLAAEIIRPALRPAVHEYHEIGEDSRHDAQDGGNE